MSDTHHAAARAALSDLDEIIRLASIWDKRSGKMAVVMRHIQDKASRARTTLADMIGSNIPPPAPRP